jgi:hypothetical protein
MLIEGILWLSGFTGQYHLSLYGSDRYSLPEFC